MQYKDAKRKVDQLEKDKTMAEGALRQLSLQLEKEFGVATVEEAEEYLADLVEREKAAKEKFESNWDKFCKKWEHVLQEG